MTINFLEKEYYNKILEVRKEFKSELEKMLKEQHLDGRVIRRKDGKEGELRLTDELYNPLRWKVKFYPVTRKGDISQKSDGWFSELEELIIAFQPVEVSNDN